MKILYYIDTMHGGGAAKKLALIANELIKRGYEVNIATNTYNKIAFLLDAKINIYTIYDKDSYSKGRLIRIFKVIRKSRKIAIDIRPDIIVTIIPHVSLFVKLATIGLKIPTIFSDETSFARKDNRIDHFVRYYFYHFADVITLLTNNDLKLLGEKYPQKVVIHNPLCMKIPQLSRKNNRSLNILVVGPTSEWYIKGFDIIINIFGRIHNRFPEWQLCFAGHIDGSIDYLCNLIKQNKIPNEKVKFLGFQSNMQNLLQNTSIYAMTSRFEGFSLTLIEAMLYGCACISFNCDGVISEVTNNGQGVLLIKDNDINSFTDKLIYLMSDKKNRQDLSEQDKSYLEQYSVSKIVDQWSHLFNNIRNTKNNTYKINK